MRTRAVTIEDTTLREGEQTPGVAFDAAAKRTIVDALATAGIRYLEVGVPAMGAGELATIRELAATPGVPTLIGWNRGVRSDLDMSLDAGLTAVHIGLPSSRLHIEDKFGRDPAWVIETAGELIDHALSQGATFVSVSAEDMGRAELDFLVEYAAAVKRAGATRLRLSDTVGCLQPARVTEIVGTLRSHVDLDLQVHMHNDFGLALANVLAGIEAGATQVHATVNGLGDRAGIAALHQVVVALECLADVRTGIDMTALPDLSRLVALYSHRAVSHNEPVVGELVFTHESGIHVDGLLKAPSSFAALDPAVVGRAHAFTLGKQSGSSAVAHVLTAAGFAIDREQATGLLPVIRDIATASGGGVSPEVVVAIAHHVLAPIDSRPYATAATDPP